MSTRIDKNVLRIKDIPSNLIEEAIFILKNKENVVNNNVLKGKTKDVIMNEVQEIIKEYTSHIETEREELKSEARKKKDKINRIKINAISISIICFIFITILCFLKFIIKTEC